MTMEGMANAEPALHSKQVNIVIPGAAGSRNPESRLLNFKLKCAIGSE
jgi:hypothetical protein